MGDNITSKTKNMYCLASEQKAKRACKQLVDQTETFKIYDEVWALNPNKAKLEAEKIVLMLWLQSTKTL